MPARQSNAPKILRLKAEIPAPHTGRVHRNEELGNSRAQHGAQRSQVPLVGNDEVEIVVWVQASALVDDMSLALDVRDKGASAYLPKRDRCGRWSRYQLAGAFCATCRFSIWSRRSSR